MREFVNFLQILDHPVQGDPKFVPHTERLNFGHLVLEIGRTRMCVLSLSLEMETEK